MANDRGQETTTGIEQNPSLAQTLNEKIKAQLLDTGESAALEYAGYTEDGRIIIYTRQHQAPHGVKVRIGTINDLKALQEEGGEPYVENMRDGHTTNIYGFTVEDVAGTTTQQDHELKTYRHDDVDMSLARETGRMVKRTTAVLDGKSTKQYFPPLDS